MKQSILMITVFASLLMCKALTVKAAYSSVIGKTKAVNKAGTMSLSGTIMIDTFSVSTATPTIQLGTYIRNNGYNKAASYTATGYRSGATVSNSPQVAVSAFTDTSITLVLSQQNTATVTVLGINLLSGLPMVLVPDPTNTKVILSAYLY